MMEDGREGPWNALQREANITHKSAELITLSSCSWNSRDDWSTAAVSGGKEDEWLDPSLITIF